MRRGITNALALLGVAAELEHAMRDCSCSADSAAAVLGAVVAGPGGDDIVVARLKALDGVAVGPAREVTENARYRAPRRNWLTVAE